MARGVLLETDYVFSPSTYTLTINNRWIRQERIMLITNVTRNIVLYNFSDSSKPLQSVSKIDAGTAMFNTQIVFATTAITGTMLATDLIQVYYDDIAQLVTYEETMIDGAQRLRTGNPQSLIDTDFEYSVQPSKWEAIFLEQNYPSFFAKPNGGNGIAATSIYGDGTSPRSLITVTTSTPHGLFTGAVVSVQETQNYKAEGTFAVVSTPSIYTFAYRGRGVVGGECIYQGLSSVYGGDVFDSAHVPGGSWPAQGQTLYGAVSGSVNTMNPWSAQSDGASPYSNITVTFTSPHGLFPATPISISGTNSFDGDYIIKQVPNTTQLIFQLPGQQSSVLVPTGSRFVAKSEGYVIHRPYDAGVAITTYNNVPGAQTIRQTRRYFRYQAGKAIQFSTGAKLTPTFNIDGLSMSGGVSGTTSTITITVVEDHGLQIGAVVYVEGVTIAGSYNPYNGYFTVTSVTNSNTFQVQKTLTGTVNTNDLNPSSNNMYCHAYQWANAAARCGMYDEQSGFFFEYDGLNISVNRRHSDKLMQGRLTLTRNSNLVLGVGTSFRKQLQTGQNIVIKGSSYRILSILSDTQLYIAPAWRGPSVSGTRFCLTQTIKILQNQWNMDKLDGTGPSGYVLDIKKMQMVYIDYSWYGAGTIRYGVRGPRGNVIFFHRIANNNVNQVSYQRSGNLPARYEVSNDPLTTSVMVAGASGVLGSVLQPTDTTIYVTNVTNWLPSGYIWVQDGTNCEIMAFSSIGAFNATAQGYPLTIAQRRASVTMTYPDQPFVYSGTTSNVTFSTDSSWTGSGGSAQVSVQPITQTCAPIVQHWGSSVVMDGQFQNDLLSLYTGGMTKYIAVPAGQTRPLVAIRVAPTVDNAIGRNFAIRELVNRMQLSLQTIGVQTNGSFRIDCILNPSQITYTNWTAAQLACTRTAVTANSGSTTLLVADTATQNNNGVIGIVPGMTVTSSAGNIPAGTIVNLVTGSNVILSNGTTSAITNGTTITFTPPIGYSGLPTDWTKDPVAANSLAQVLYFDNCGSGGGGTPGSTASAGGVPTGAIFQGDSVFSFFSENGGGASNYNSSVYSLSGIKEMGNSYLSGDGSVSSPSFPNGPDVLVIACTNIGVSTSNIAARVSWTEAQA